MFLILILWFLPGFDRLFTNFCHCGIIKYLHFPLLFNKYHSHLSIYCVIIYRRFVPFNYGFIKFIFLAEGKQCVITNIDRDEHNQCKQKKYICPDKNKKEGFDWLNDKKSSNKIIIQPKSYPYCNKLILPWKKFCDKRLMTKKLWV